MQAKDSAWNNLSEHATQSLHTQCLELKNSLEAMSVEELRAFDASSESLWVPSTTEKKK